MSVKFSNSYNAKVKRIKAIPKLYEDYAMTVRKKDAEGLIKTFHDGIKKNTLGLQNLKPETIEAKKRKGYPKPETPLYGLGDKTDRSLMNSLLLRKLKNGYKVYFSKKKHHSAGITLERLWQTHENGAKIVRGDTIIIIPARHPFKKTYSKYLKTIKENSKETSRHVKRALTEYINTGKTTMLDKMKKTVIKK
jgi:hypothetical protein